MKIRNKTYKFKVKRDEIIGQEEVWQRRIEMVKEDRLPHAI